MPISINQAQSSLLQSGFLDTLGSNPELNDLQLSESVRTLILLAGGLVIDAQTNLQQGGHVSSGALSDSIKVLNPEYVGRTVKVDVELLFYYQFLNRGVRGTKSGSGEFAFKTDFPSKKMVNEIQKWIKRAGLSSTRVNAKKSISHLERKGKSISALNTGRSTAYAVARSIKQHGIRKTNFFDKAVRETAIKIKDELGRAFTIDIINSLPKTLGTQQQT